jgi:hypothetical protein
VIVGEDETVTETERLRTSFACRRG